jgi:tRNA threonylcarbamoyladenosine biosynthesis protein TsaB
MSAEPGTGAAARVEAVNGPPHLYAPAGPLLALETSTPLGSVAIGQDGRIRAEITAGVEIRHSEALLPAVAFALERAGLDRSDVAGVVVGAGPGSFTGVRIAAATAKGFAHGLGIPLFAWSSLAALAAGAGAGQRAVCALFDARRDEVYAACYRFPGTEGMITELEPAALPIAEAIRSTLRLNPIYVGDGALKNAGAITAAGGEIGAATIAVPRASALLWLAWRTRGGSRIENVNAWQPVYVRPPGATPARR